MIVQNLQLLKLGATSREQVTQTHSSSLLGLQLTTLTHTETFVTKIMINMLRQEEEMLVP